MMPVKTIIKNHDVCTESPEKHYKWADLESIGAQQAVPYFHHRPLPKVTAKRAMLYISQIIKAEGYPFQLTYAMMLPLWYRFTETWCDYGDESMAMNAI